MASLQTLQNFLQFCHCLSSTPKLPHLQSPNLIPLSRNLLFSGKIRASSASIEERNRFCSTCCFCKTKSEVENVSIQVQEENQIERPQFDINLAVILAGFAFEAYTTPPENIGKREVDAANCETVFLSASFLREIYDGQLFIKLKKGLDLPAMDPWGTSDPYVVFQLDNQVIKSQVKWGTKEPTWNEDFTLNIKQDPTKNLQVATWDANLVTPHKRMGNGSISLECLCDGNLHEVLVELEGMGGGGKIQLEWKIPIVTEFLRRSGFESAFKMVVGSETVQASQFVQFAFGQIKSLNGYYLQNGWLSKLSRSNTEDVEKFSNPVVESDVPPQEEDNSDCSINERSCDEDRNLLNRNGGTGNEQTSLSLTQVGDPSQSDKNFWKNYADLINQNVVQKLGLPPPEKIKWDGFDLLNRIGLQSQRIAEAGYIESGLASPESQDTFDRDVTNEALPVSNIQSSLPDIKKVTQDLLRQTDSILGALMVVNATVSQLNKDTLLFGKNERKVDASTELEDDISQYSKNKEFASPLDGSELDEKKAEEMRALFSTAESAMEAWAMLATSLGHPSFIKSEFEKLCFLDNPSTDTQVAIWRDSARKRLVVAFRGTEQTRWKDLRTDLMLVPAGLNPERIGGDFKQEVQVHSGFLSAYDSVRTRILSLIKLAVEYLDDGAEPLHKWQVYVTGHSLGGALATLLALELSSSQLAKRGAVSVTMYNFGSPRVGNKKFAEVYNEKVKDSWRVVNHRDIIPTVPRLMGYCHVAQPVYLAPGDLKIAMVNMELLGDGYQGDVIGESTPDVLVTEFMKGEKELIEKILNTEINIFRSIRDGSALMQHMEDFYYITLLENVRSNYQTVASSQTSDEGSISIS
ncbi:Feruloyl esterase A precursor [Actinidia chinensis var. chinensis]|uniref:Feruloyl esterase A n=1 Tax=Actinidia chinensis var. chinensis TaxID=1590841 RepID=A0A2R6R907_ACTCC|nr:Feruloyl esterase A precursor [Actinidia chinensis var. chinensis]